MMNEAFTLPLAFDLAATFFVAVTGGLTAMRKKFDFVGVFFLALVTGLGGGLLRDGIFLQQIPAVIGTPYLLTIVAATVLSLVFGNRLNALAGMFLVVDAVGLGLYAVVGIQKALVLNLSWAAAILIGLVNAVGGGVIRDLLTGDQPLVFRPGEFYAAATFAGCCLFVALSAGFGQDARWAALGAVLLVVGVRLGSVRFGWRTRAAQALMDDPRS